MSVKLSLRRMEHEVVCVVYVECVWLLQCVVRADDAFRVVRSAMRRGAGSTAISIIDAPLVPADPTLWVRTRRRLPNIVGHRYIWQHTFLYKHRNSHVSSEVYCLLSLR